MRKYEAQGIYIHGNGHPVPVGTGANPAFAERIAKALNLLEQMESVESTPSDPATEIYRALPNRDHVGKYPVEWYDSVSTTWVVIAACLNQAWALRIASLLNTDSKKQYTGSKLPQEEDGPSWRYSVTQRLTAHDSRLDSLKSQIAALSNGVNNLRNAINAMESQPELDLDEVVSKLAVRMSRALDDKD